MKEQHSQNEDSKKAQQNKWWLIRAALTFLVLGALVWSRWQSAHSSVFLDDLFLEVEYGIFLLGIALNFWLDWQLYKKGRSKWAFRLSVASLLLGLSAYSIDRWAQSMEDAEEVFSISRPYGLKKREHWEFMDNGYCKRVFRENKLLGDAYWTWYQYTWHENVLMLDEPLFKNLPFTELKLLEQNSQLYFQANAPSNRIFSLYTQYEYVRKNLMNRLSNTSIQ